MELKHLDNNNHNTPGWLKDAGGIFAIGLFLAAAGVTRVMVGPDSMFREILPGFLVLETIGVALMAAGIIRAFAAKPSRK